jgi:hypothetical protein
MVVTIPISLPFHRPRCSRPTPILALGYYLPHSVCCLAALCTFSVTGHPLPAAFTLHLLASAGPCAALPRALLHAIHNVRNLPISLIAQFPVGLTLGPLARIPHRSGFGLFTRILRQFSRSFDRNASGISLTSNTASLIMPGHQHVLFILNRAETAHLLLGVAGFWG